MMPKEVAAIVGRRLAFQAPPGERWGTVPARKEAAPERTSGTRGGREQSGGSLCRIG